MSKIKIIDGFEFEAYEREPLPENKVIENSHNYFEFMDQRRSVREFSDHPIPREVIENIIKTASTAPSGAHKQPWTFAIVSNPDLKKQIREAAEKEEYESYNSRMSEEWLDDLRPLQTDWHKPFLEIAPYLIIVFKKAYDIDDDGNKHTNYYVNESVGLAAGFLISAIHHAGLVGLTHTPSPMNFLTKLLDRSANERPILLVPVGHPAEDTYVPKLSRKPLDEVAIFYE